MTFAIVRMQNVRSRLSRAQDKAKTKNFYEKYVQPHWPLVRGLVALCVLVHVFTPYKILERPLIIARALPFMIWR